jgi:nicotinamidase-related amidase
MPETNDARRDRRARHSAVRGDHATSRVALLMIDWFGPWDFPEREQVLSHAEPAARRAGKVLVRARDAGVPVIYANDNFGQWRSDFQSVIGIAGAAGDRPARIVRAVHPSASDYFVLKPRHSAFFATPLELLLSHLGTRVLVLTGIATDLCVLATAIDARLRDLDVVVLKDATAAKSTAQHAAACRQVEAFGATVRSGSAIRWATLRGPGQAT